MKVKLYQHYWIYLLVALALIVISAWSLITYGLKPGLDFTGGTLMELKLESIKEDPLALALASESAILSEEEPTLAEADPEDEAAPASASADTTPSDPLVVITALTEDKIWTALSGQYNLTSVQSAGDNQLIVRGEQIDNQRQEELLEILQERIDPQIQVVRFESIGPTMGKELLQKTLTGIGIVAVILVVYLWRQFKDLKFGICALTEVLVDIFVILGLFSLYGRFFQVEIDSMFVTALLTTISFVAHDTIVMSHRIIELHKQFPQAPYREIAEAGVLQTLTRSLNTSVTIIFMLTALVVMGGPSIHWFAVALLAGIILGTFSTPFISIPLSIFWDEVAKRIRAKKAL